MDSAEQIQKYCRRESVGNDGHDKNVSSACEKGPGRVVNFGCTSGKQKKTMVFGVLSSP